MSTIKFAEYIDLYSPRNGRNTKKHDNKSINVNKTKAATNEPKVACRNKLLLVWLPTCLRISYSIA